MCSGKKDTRSFRCIFDFKNINLDSLSWFKFFTFYLLVFTEDTVCLTEIYADVLAHHTLYDTGNNFFFHSVILIIKNFTLFFTNFLKNDVLCILCCDTSKFFGVDLNFNNITEFCIGIKLLSFYQRNLHCRIFYEFLNLSLCINAEIAGFRINCHMHIICFTEMVLASLDQGLLDSSQ